MENTKKIKRYLIILIAFILIGGTGFLTPLTGMTPAGMRVLGIFAGTLLLWLVVSIDWPSLVCIIAIGLMPMFTFKNILENSFGNETVVFLICTFLCTHALSKTSFLRRCALAMVTSNLARKGPWHFTVAFFSAVLIMGCIMSPTVLFVIFLSILEEVYKVLEVKKGDKVAKMLMMGLVFCTSISAGMTPIAHVFSTMALGFYETATGEIVGYGQYMIFAIPVGCICFILMLLVFKFILRPDMSKIVSVDISHLKNSLAPFGKNELYVFIIYLLVIAAWVLPSLLKNIFPNICASISGLGTAIPPMMGVVALSIIAPEKTSLLNFSEAMKEGIPWSSIIMCTGTLTIGVAMTNEEVGISKWLIDVIGPQLTNVAPLFLVIIITLWAAIQTNLSSNMVTVTVVTAVAIPILLATNGTVNTAAVVCIIGMMAAYAFATPPAMPHVAIAGGSGWCSVGDLFVYGLILMLISVVVTVFIGYPIACLVM